MESLTPLLRTLPILAVVLILLLTADRWLHRHLQGVLLLLTNDQEIALWLYALVLFPGVLLHELSHAVVAGLVGVRIGRISIFPRRIGGRIQLGFVPIEETDFLRASLIGAAPLIVGSAVVILTGHLVFGTPEVLTALTAADWVAALQGMRGALQAPDVWIWAYFVFTIGNTMLPSRADTHAWPIFGIALVVVLLIVALAGAGAVLLDGLSRFLVGSVRWVVLLGASTLLIDVPFFICLFLCEKLIERLKGQRIVYH